ncbi:MAG: hypothetical protein ACD_21C00318G0002 [uncultured bacterium]|nr:MAG: hypothetical protein ACD_21C00318G0002 [uncultured bacterium]
MVDTGTSGPTQAEPLSDPNLVTNPPGSAKQSSAPNTGTQTSTGGQLTLNDFLEQVFSMTKKGQKPPFFSEAQIKGVGGVYVEALEKNVIEEIARRPEWEVLKSFLINKGFTVFINGIYDTYQTRDYPAWLEEYKNQLAAAEKAAEEKAEAEKKLQQDVQDKKTLLNEATPVSVESDSSENTQKKEEKQEPKDEVESDRDKELKKLPPVDKKYKNDLSKLSRQSITKAGKAAYSAWLDDNALKVQDGLYAQRDENGNKFFIVAELSTKNVDRVLQEKSGSKMLKWKNVPRDQKKMIEYKCLQDWKKVSFRGEIGLKHTETALSKLMPETNGDWRGWANNISNIKFPPGKREKLMKEFVTKVVGRDPERLLKLLSDLSSSEDHKDAKLLARIEKSLTKEQKKMWEQEKPKQGQKEEAKVVVESVPVPKPK